MGRPYREVKVYFVITPPPNKRKPNNFMSNLYSYENHVLMLVCSCIMLLIIAYTVQVTIFGR